jgi:hypothetical protein
MQCKSCNKLFCKYCYIQLGKGNMQADYQKIATTPATLGNIPQKMDY